MKSLIVRLIAAYRIRKTRRRIRANREYIRRRLGHV